MYDIDRNGYIEKKEMKKIMDAIYDLLGEEKKKVRTVLIIKLIKYLQKWIQILIINYQKMNLSMAVCKTII